MEKTGKLSLVSLIVINTSAVVMKNGHSTFRALTLRAYEVTSSKSKSYIDIIIWFMIDVSRMINIKPDLIVYDHGYIGLILHLHK